MTPDWVVGLGSIGIVFVITIGCCVLFDYLTHSGPFDPWYREMKSRQRAQRDWQRQERRWR